MENSSYTKNREKDIQDLGRYDLIVKSFNKNKDRINANIDNLNFLYDSQLGLTNTFPNTSDLADRVASVLFKIGNLLNDGRTKLVKIEDSKREKRKELPIIGRFFE